MPEGKILKVYWVHRGGLLEFSMHNSGENEPSNGRLLLGLQVSVGVCVVCLAGLFLKGRNWAREASLAPLLAQEVQRNELALRSMIFEAYQWNQSHSNPELGELFRRINLKVQVQPTASNSVAPALHPKPATR